MFLRRLAGPLLAAAGGRLKETTGIAGLEVVPDAREKLIALYRQTLAAVEAIPSAAAYRRNVEKIAQHRLRVCEEEPEWEVIERRIACGQVEELLAQATDELQLIPKMAEWKPWEVPEGHKVELVVDDDHVPAHLPIHRNS